MGRPEGLLEERVDAAVDAAAVAPPQVFVRTFTAPSGFPWEQARAAQLEARHGAPLPLAELMHRVRRLAPWSPGAVARYAVFYVRRRDYKAPFETTLDVDGLPVRVAFGGGPDLSRAQTVAGVALVASLIVALVAGGAFMAYAARSEAEGRLAALEQQVAARKRQADRQETDRDRSARLAVARGERGLPSDVLADVAWLTRSRTAEARIVALHWDRGLMAVESRGSAAPVETVERQVVRSNRPLRPGVWLWGITPTPPGAASAPVAAEFKP